jgi:hypothetical protein
MNRQTVQWEIANTAALIGATICGVIKTPDLSSYGFKVESPDGETRNVWVECDPEGNGPGHLTIEAAKASLSAGSRSSQARA